MQNGQEELRLKLKQLIKTHYLALCKCSTPFTVKTGYDEKSLQEHLDNKTDFETFFENVQINSNVSLIKGVICGYRIEEIEDKLMQKIRYLDKLIDELAKGKTMGKILRKS